MSGEWPSREYNTDIKREGEEGSKSIIDNNYTYSVQVNSYIVYKKGALDCPRSVYKDKH